ncbi:MAG: HIT domain-containing protein [Armatimonadetes bacterium]|nr:HIT domain-containing protein [Armatimonadota bacterium]
MERIWAPWRLAYVEIKQPEGCIFCQKPAAGRDTEELVLYRGESCFVLLNLFPYNNGHLMVAPYRHVGDFTELTADEGAELIRLAQRMVRVLGHAYHPDGYNLGMNLGRTAGAGIEDHLHLHVVPRWNGDTNFMPVIAGTKVLPDTLVGTYRTLSAALAALESP